MSVIIMSKENLVKKINARKDALVIKCSLFIREISSKSTKVQYKTPEAIQVNTT